MANRIIFTCTTVPTRQEYTNWVSANTDTTKNKTYTLTDGYQVDLYVNDNVTTIEGPIFAESTIKTILFNTPNVTQLSTYTPGSTTWSDGLFYNCRSLRNVHFPKNLQIIGGSCFCQCSSLISAILPDTVTIIDGDSFRSCSNLYYIKIPASVTSIGNAFSGLPNDVQIVCEGTTPAATGSDPFGSNHSLNIYVPSSALTDYQQSTYSWGLYNLAATPSNHRFICEFKNSSPYYSDFLNANTITASNKRITLSDSYIDIIYMNDSLTNLPQKVFYRINADSIEFDSKIITYISGNYSTYPGSFVKSEAKYIKLPESVTIIGEGAFTNCNLKFLYIPSTLSTLYGNIFYSEVTYDNVHSYSINSIVVDEDNTTFSDGDGSDCIIKLSDSQLVIGCGNTIIPQQVTKTTNTAFTHCANLINFTVPSRMTKYSFYSCENLQTVVLENGLTNISSSAFSDCTSLQSITIPSSVTKIDSNAFYNCTSLQSITIPSSVTKIDYNAFSSCTSLQSVTIPSSVTSIGGGIFSNCTSLQTAVLENGITTVPDSIFSGCTSLQSVTIPSSVTSIGYYAFYNCTSLQSITIPSSVTSIGQSAFINTGWWNSQEDGLVVEDIWCLGLKGTTVTTVTIPQNVENLANSCFTNNTDLVSITINDNITKIPNNCFYGCSNLETVNISSNSHITYFEGAAFYSCSKLTSINLPNNLLYIGGSCFKYSGLEGDLIIPDSVEEIYSGAFANTKISSVTTGKNWAVSRLNEGGVFEYCQNLTKVNWNTINYLNLGGTYIRRGYFAYSPVSEFNISDDVIDITDCLFFNSTNTTLQTLTIPENVTRIGESAFINCTNLLSVTCKATTPPTLGQNNFTASGDTLYVPVASKSAYQAKTSWRNAFTTIAGFYEVTSTVTGSGSVSPSPATVPEGESATLTITPDEGYGIFSVTDNGTSVPVTSTGMTYTISNIAADHTIAVVFKPLFTITTSAGEGGSITPTMTVMQNEDATVVITPNAGYSVSHVYVDSIDQGSILNYSFQNVVANHTVTAEFVALYTVSTTTTEGGSISPESSTVAAGSDVTLTITPDEGMLIFNVLDNDTPVPVLNPLGMTYTISNIQENHTVEAIFMVAQNYGFDLSEMIDTDFIIQTLEELEERK